MKNNFRYTKLPNRKLPKFQQNDGGPGEVKYDQNGYPIMVNPNINFQIPSGSQDWPYLQGLNLRTKVNWDQRFKNWGQGFNRGLDSFGQGFNNTFDKIGSGINNIIQGRPTPDVPCPNGYERGPNGLCSKVDPVNKQVDISSINLGPDDDPEAAAEYVNQQYNNTPEAQQANLNYGNQLIQQQGAFKFGKARDLRRFTKAYNQQYGTDYKSPGIIGTGARAVGAVAKGIGKAVISPFTNPKIRAGLGELGMKTMGAINLADYITTDLDKSAKNWQSNYMDEAYRTASVSDPDRGDWNINGLGFRNDENRNPNKGLYGAKLGGDINTDTMRIRITGSPEMKYGGQSRKYGLDLNQKKVQVQGEPSYHESVTNTISQVPRNQANIEAEKGETVLIPQDSNKRNPYRHQFIEGKKHYDNGTPLNVPDLSYVISDALNLPNQYYKEFGLPDSKKKITFAKVARKYKLNEHVAKAEDTNSDPLLAKTSQMMADNTLSKLQRLAYLQEELKGFPAGIPEVSKSLMPEAKYGGYLPLPSYQTKGQKPLTKAEIDKLVQSGQGWQYVPGTNNTRIRRTIKGVDRQDPTREPGKDPVTRPGVEPQVQPGISGGVPDGSWDRWVEEQLQRGVTYEQLAEKGHGTIPGLKARFPGKYRPASPEVVEPGQPEKIYCTEEQIKAGYKYNEATKMCEKPNETVEELYGEDPPGDPNEDPNDDPGDRYGYGRRWRVPFKADLPYRLNTLGAFRHRTDKMIPFLQQENPEKADLFLKDPLQKIQNIYAGSKIDLDSSGQGAAANALALQGKTAEAITGAIDEATNYNIPIANQVEQYNSQLGTQSRRLNLAARDKYINTDLASATREKENADRMQDAGIMQAIGDQWYNRQNRYDSNMFDSEYYYHDPYTGKTQMKFAPSNVFTSGVIGPVSNGQEQSGSLSTMGTDYQNYYDLYYSQLGGDEKTRSEKAHQLANAAVTSGRTSNSVSYGRNGQPSRYSRRTSGYGNPYNYNPQFGAMNSYPFYNQGYYPPQRFMPQQQGGYDYSYSWGNPPPSDEQE